MEEEERKDPNYSFEPLSNPEGRDEDLYNPKNRKEKEEFSMILEQRRLDDIKIIMY